MSATTTLQYDGYGRLIRTTDARGAAATPPYSTTFEYDAADNLTARVDGLSHRWTFEYDLADRLTKSTDALNRLTQEQLTGQTALTFTYDAMGQQLTMTDPSGTTTNAYDVLGRVTSETNGRGNKLSYEYDVAGRRTAMVDPENGRTLYAYYK